MTTPYLSASRERWLLLTLAGIQFTHILDFMIMMPLGPQFREIFNITDAQFGVLVSAYTLAAGVSGLAASTYVDRFDRKRLLLTMYGLFALATLACGLAPTYEFLMGARLAAGLFGGVLSALSQTIVADVVPFERRGRAMAVVMSAFSFSTVAGVPLGLVLANHLGWHATFVAIALLSGVLVVVAIFTMPPLRAHLEAAQGRSAWSGIRQVLADANHLRAFAFSLAMMSAGFVAIPYITLYMRANVGLAADDIPYIYLVGGAATLVSARWVGRLSDRRGKVAVFSALALALGVPLMALTLMPAWPLPVVLVVSTLLFLVMSGRMIPGMAIVASAANPALRGTFMALNSATQSTAMGIAAFVGGQLISRGESGAVLGYWHAGLVGVVCSLLSIWLARRLVLHGATPHRI
jgi:predicted MFS family arabinose efflux permease